MESPKEHPSTYFVQDRSNHEEMLRLEEQDCLLTTGMGGVLSEQPNTSRFERVLDVGCGPGGWLIQTAATYPAIAHLVGVDVSTTIIERARVQAESAQISDRVTFQTGDALRMLEFSSKHFDLVNQRLGASFLRKWDWPKLLQEYQRICHPSGIIRITEGEIGGETTSSALTHLHTLMRTAAFHAGQFFTPTRDGMTSHLASLLAQYGLTNIQTHSHRLHYRGGTPEGQRYAEDMARAFRTGVPFLRKWVKLPETYEQLYQQALLDMQQPTFEASWTLLTAWGTPSKYAYTQTLRS
jgi:ubiquinone/menaquinone biosynthesis C-methylase UbiE